MSILNLMTDQSQQMTKTAAQEAAELQEKGVEMYKVGARLFYSHVKQAAEEIDEASEGKGKKEDESEESSEKRVKKRTAEIFKKLKEEKEKK